MKFALPLLLFFAATATPVAAQDDDESLKASVAWATIVMDTCDILFKNIATFQQSIDGCNQQIVNLEKRATDDTPEQRGISLAAKTHIDANIAEMYIRRKEPDLSSGCAIITRGLKRFAEHPEGFPDAEGIGAIITKAQSRLEGVSSRCSFGTFSAHSAIMRGEYGVQMQKARGSCQPAKVDKPDFYAICAEALGEVTEVFGNIAEPTPLDLNIYLSQSLEMAKTMFRAADEAGAFEAGVCKVYPTVAPLTDVSVHPMSSMTAFSLKTAKSAFENYEKRCAALK
jgi:hypothetical protein